MIWTTVSSRSRTRERARSTAGQRPILRALAAFIVMAASVGTTLLTDVAYPLDPAAAVELPPNDDDQLYIQTSGPNANIGIGDWYTNPAGGNEDHLLEITVPPTWPAGLTITVALFDPEIATPNNTSGLLAFDEPRNGADDTEYWVTDPNGTELVRTTYTPTGGTNGEWTELITFTPIAGGGLYTLENSTADDDDNSWRLSVAHDPDCADFSCTTAELVNGNEYDDPDGVPGTADEVEVPIIRSTFQHAGSGLVCNDFFFYVDGSTSPITLHNYDMDNSGSVVYTLPDGSTEIGTVSGGTRWNNSSNTTRVGDSYAVDGSQIGWWMATICLSAGNQYIFEGETGKPVFLEKPPPLPDLELAKTDNVENVIAGQTLDYLITYDNVSDDSVSPAPARSVQIVDTLPAGTTFVGCSFVSGSGGTCAYDPGDGTVTWDLDDEVPSGESGAVGLEIIVDPSATGQLTNLAEVTWLDAYGRNYASDAATDIDTVVESDLQITKTSDAAAGVDAGDTVTYTVDITNVGLVTNTGITVSDPVPAGTSYAPESTMATYFEATSIERFNDDFESGTYSGGSANWASNWQETDGGGGGATGGDVDIQTEDGDESLHLQDNATGIERELDLSAYSAATLSFDMKIVGFDVITDTIELRASDDGGASWTVLDTWEGPLDESDYATYTFDLTPFIDTDTAVGFFTAPTNMGNADDAFIDDLEIVGVTTSAVTKANVAAASPILDDGALPNLITLADGATLGPGQTMTITYDVVVDDQPGLARITNAVSAGSDQSPSTDAVRRDPVLVADITGRAFDDEDGDDVRDVSDDGIASVTVELLDSTGTVIATTLTNPTGGYRFDNLVAGDYSVRFTTPATATIVAQDAGADDTVDSDIDGTGETASFSLSGGTDVTDVDAGYVFPSTIGDRVWIDANGNGAQDGGEVGLDGVTVELLDDAGTVVASTTTDDGTVLPLGMYRFDDVAPGTYSIRFTEPTGFVFTQPGQTVGNLDSDPDRTTGDSAQFVVNSGSTDLTIDAGVFQPIAIGDFVWLDLDGDGVQDGGEPGAPNVVVNLLDDAGVQIDTTTTDSNGAYRFNVAEPGTFRVEVEVAGFSFAPLDAGSDDAVDSDIDPATGQSADFVVASGTDDLSIDAAIIPTTIGDRVWTDTDADGVQDAGEDGLGGVTVNLLDGSGTLLDSTTTTAAGLYSFDVGPGDVIVEFETPTGFSRSPIDQGGDDTADSDADATTGRTPIITITAPTPIDDVDAGMFTGATIGDRAWLDRDGDGVQSADTTATGEPGLGGVTVELLDATDTVIASTTTLATASGGNPVGWYEFADVAPGTYTVRFNEPTGFVFTSTDAGADDAVDSDPSMVTGISGPITVTSGGTDVSVDAGFFEFATVSGEAWEDEDGDGIRESGERPIANVPVSLIRVSDGFTIATTTTNASGAYTFPTVAPGDYSVEMLVPGLPAPDYIFTLANIGADDTIDSDIRWPSSVDTATFTVESGDDIVNVDGGLIEPAFLGDRVWRDLDGDGVQDAGEPGVGGVTVNLLNASGTVIDTTTTLAAASGGNPVGWYEFLIGVLGQYRVEFEATAGTEFTVANIGADDELDSDANPTTGRTALFTLTSGDDFPTSLDAGIYEPSSIGDRVWSDLDADGIQDAGEPGLGSVTVNLLNGAGTQIATTTTLAAASGGNPVGYYEFADLAPGDYIIEVETPAGHAPSPLNAGADDALDSDIDQTTGRTATVVVASGTDSDTTDAGFFEASSIGDRVWVDIDGDGIQDAGESGLGGVTVNLLNATGTEIDTTTTLSAAAGGNPIGHYEFIGLTPDDYIIEVELPSGRVFTTQGAGTATDSDVDATTGRSDAITLTSGASNTSIDAGVLTLASIGDRVWTDSDADGVQDAGEPGLGSITVNLLDSTGAIVDTTTTLAAASGGNPIGFYEFSDITPGDYRIEIVAPSGYEIAPANAGADDTVDSDLNTTTGRSALVTLSSGSAITDLDAGLYQNASIGDRVWSDLDADGIQDAGEPGLGNITVNLLNAASTIVDTTTTLAAASGGNPIGYYEFTDITPGDYRIEVIAPTGFVISPQNAGADDTADSDVNTTTGRSALATLTSGASTADLDAGLFELGSIGDRVWSDLDADGIQDAGEPGLGNITVNLLNATGTVVDTTTTLAAASGGNPIGYYEFSDITPGDYTVEIVVPTGQVISPLDTGADDAIDSDINPSTAESATITVTSGLDSNATDAGLYPGATIGDRVWSDTDGDGIQDAGEPGLGGITVNLLNAGGTVIDTTTTLSAAAGGNPIGHYEFTGLAEGDYRVEIVVPTGSTITAAGAGADGSVDSDIDPLTARSAAITVIAGGDVDTVDAGLFIAASIGDRVWSDLDADGVQDAGEPGLGGITVNLLDSAGAVVDTTTTLGAAAGGNPIGYYEFTDITPGDYRVQVVAPAGSTFSPQNTGADDTIDSDVATNGRTALISLDSGDSITTTDAGLFQPGSIGDRVWTDLDGDGIQDAGEPGLGGVTVNLLDSTGAIVDTTTTLATASGGNPIGSYEFTNVAPGSSYRVAIVAPTGFVVSAIDAGSDDALDSDVDPSTLRSSLIPVANGSAIDSVDAGLHEPATIGDRVWSDLDADGIQDAAEPGLGNITVNLLDSTGAIVDTTTTLATASGGNPIGHYEFTDITPGDYRVQVVIPAGSTASPQNTGADDTVDSDIAADGRTAVITLSSGDAFDGTDAGLYQASSIGDRVWSDLDADGIQDAGEPGLGNITVNLLNAAGTQIDTTTTLAAAAGGNPIGYYEFTGLAPASYTVEFIAPTGSVFSPQNAGADDAVDSDAGTDGRTALVTVSSADVVVNVDAGLYELGSIGDRVWTDLDADGIQDAGEPGLGGITVNLLNTSGAVVDSTTTLATASGGNPIGHYDFTDITPGDYRIEVIAPAGYEIAPANAGADDTVDSDISTVTGRTPVFTMASGDTVDSVDAGLHQNATLADRVWTDSDGDGIQDAGELGLGGVTVNLLDASGTQIDTTTALSAASGGNPIGHYEFTDITPGDYRIEVIAPAGYEIAPANAGADDTADSDISTATGQSPLITLDSGENDTTVDAGLFELGSIGDRVWSDLDADGIQDAAEPGLGNITVNLLDSTGAVIDTTTTLNAASGGNPIGFYEFTDITPGDYRIEVVAPAGSTFSPQNTGADDTVDSDSDPTTGRSATITVTSDAVITDADSGIFQSSSIGDRVWSDTDADGIQDAAEPGLGGITVNLLNGAGTVIDTTTTLTAASGGNPIGYYEFTGLAPATYTIEFIAPTGSVFSPQNIGADDTIDSDVDPLNGRVDVTTTSAFTSVDIDAGLFVPVVIGDRVWADTDGDGIQDASEAGLGGITVNLLDGTGAVINTTTTATTAGGGLQVGEFAFTGVTPGEYEIAIVIPAGSGASPRDAGADDTVDADIDPVTGRSGTFIADSGDSIDIDAGLWVGSTIGDLVFRDDGGDGSQAGDPGLPGVTVRLLDASGTTELATATSNAAGAYAFTGLAPGDYIVDVVETTAPAGFVLTTANDDAAVALTSGTSIDTIDFGFEPTGDISITKTPDQDVVSTGDATFTITVTNGGAALTGVTVTDPLSPACDNAIGALAAGATVTYSCTQTNVTADFTNTAGVVGTTPGGLTVSGSDSADVTVLIPSIDIAKTPDSQSITTGATATFTITVTNTGTADLSAVEVVDALAPGCSRTIGDLAAGATTTFNCTLADVTADFTNSAIVTGDTSIGTTVTDTDTADVTVLVPGLGITKSPPTQTIGTGGTASFTVVVTNTGATTLNNVVVSDPLTPTCDTTIATLAAGQSRTIDCSLTNVGANFTNVVSVSATDPAGSMLNASDTADVVVVEPSIELTKSPDLQGIASGATADFTITVANTGDVDLTNVTVTDPLAPTCDTTITTLAAGTDTTINCSLTNVTADFTNTATVNADTPLGTSIGDSDTAVVDVLEPGIALAKTPDAQAITEGGTADFTITVANTGDVDLTNVTVTDPLAPTCDTTITTLAAGTDTTINCSLTNVTADFTNTATVNATAFAGTPSEVVVSATDTADVTTLSTGIDIQKTPNIQQVEPGATATFTITVTNSGASPLSSVTVTDPLAAACDQVIGDLAVGAFVTYSCTQTNVTADFTNTAIVDATDPIGATLRDIDTAIVDVVAADIEIAKTPDVQQIAEGGDATFTITVTNTGHIALLNVSVSDAAVPACDRAIGSLAVGAGVTFTCSATSVGADFTNTAAVNAQTPGGLSVSDSDTADVEILVPSIAVDKTPDAQELVSDGTATFTITARNDGAVTLDSVVVTDAATPACDRSIGTLDPGQSVTYSCTLANVAADFINTVDIAATSPTGATVTDSDTADVTVLEPSISITKNPALQTVVSDDDASFTIEVTNDGGVDLTNVLVTDPLAPDCDANLGTLLVGETQTITCDLTNVTADLTNTVDVIADDALGNPTTASDTAEVIVVSPGISIDKTPDTQQILAGGTANFTITVTNTGTETIANATVTDPSAPGCDFAIANLAPGESQSTACSQTGVAADFVNIARVDGADTLGNAVADADDAAVDVIDPSLAIEKGPDTQVVVENGTATFTITVTNTGDVDLDAVAVTDPLAPSCDRTIGTLAAGSSRSFVCSSTNVAGAFTNTATAQGTDPLSNLVTTTDDATVTTIDSSIDLQKTPDLQTIDAGDDATFTITVTNTGATTLTSVVVSDAQTATCERALGDLAPGDSTNFTCTRTNVTSDFTNTASVEATDPVGTVVSAIDTGSVDVLTPAIGIQKSPDGQTVVENGTATFSIEVANLGDADLTNVAISDPLASACDTTVGALPIGTTATVTCSVSDVTADFTNTATVVADTPAGATLTESDTADVDVLVPDVSISKTPATQSVPTNGTADFTVTVTNSGQTNLTNVVVTDPLAPGCGTTTPIALTPGQSQSFTCSLTVATSDVTNVASVTADDPIGTEHTASASADASVFAAGSATGVVFADADADATYDTAPAVEAGFATVTVSLIDGAGIVVDTVDTLADGSFSFVDVPVGDYTVSVDRSTGVPGDRLLTTGNESQVVTIAEGANTTAGPVGYTEPAAIEGAAFIDADGNGSDEGTPLANVGVEVLDSSGTVLASTITAADGSWSATGLFPGDHTVRFTPPSGFVATSQDIGDDALDSDPNPATGVTATIPLPPGVTSIDNDAGYYQPVTIGDTVFIDHDADGVQNTTGLGTNEPGLPGIDVTITWAGPDGVIGTADDTSTTVTTDAAGDYTTAGLPPGTHQITVDEPADLTVTTGNDPSTVTLASGTSDLDIDVGLVGSGQLSGTVIHDLDGDGTRDGAEPGLGTVDVTVTWAGPDGIFDTADDSVFETSTAADGTWVVVALPAGDYRVDVDENSEPTGLNAVSFDDDTTPDGTTVVVLGAGETRTDIDTGLADGATIGDTVFGDTDRNGTQDGGEPGLGSVSVIVTFHGDDDTLGTADDLVFTTTTAADGSWTIDDLPGGTFTVVVDSTTIPAGYRDPSTARVTVPLGGVDLDADIGLTPNDPATIPITYDVTVLVGGTPSDVPLTDPNTDDATVTVNSGAVPGVTLLPDGTWSGTASTPGVYELDVTVCDPFDACTDHTLVVRVVAVPTTTPTATPTPLARTGSSTIVLGTVGLTLLTLGAFLVLSRRRDQLDTES